MKRQHLTSSEQDLELFIGENWTKFERLADAMSEERWSLPLSWSWAGLLVTIPWFLYRRMYAFAAVIGAVILVLGFLFPDRSLGMFLIFAVFGKTLVLQHANSKISKINAENLPEDERQAKIQDAGRTSVAGAVAGSIITFGPLALFLIYEFFLTSART